MPGLKAGQDGTGPTLLPDKKFIFFASRKRIFGLPCPLFSSGLTMHSDKTILGLL